MKGGKDGKDSSVIRFVPEIGLKIALKAIADHLRGISREGK